ncbi:MAG: D-alanine--D-alanine ligase, partial [Campylobacterota bacterium]|nr:D-alanine--D-alanine ligase [Campylobacterota bacterium]
MKFIVLFGSKSYEHEISIISAISMQKVIKDEIIYIFIDKNRKMYHIPNNIIKSTIFSSGEYQKCDIVNFCENGFIKKRLFSNQLLEFDVVLNLVHGGDGEDGTIASLFKFFNIPFIGPRNLASVVSSNKFLTKSYSKDNDVKTLECKY